MNLPGLPCLFTAIVPFIDVKTAHVPPCQAHWELTSGRRADSSLIGLICDPDDVIG
jgi:hypothetical protein